MITKTTLFRYVIYVLSATIGSFAVASNQSNRIPVGENEPLYVGFRMYDFPIVSTDPASAYFILDEKRNISTVDEHYKLKNEPCAQGWRCLSDYFEFGIPEKCDSLRSGISWEYKKRIFRVHESYLIGKRKTFREVFVINIENKDGEPYGSALYSREKGLEAYSYFYTNPDGDVRIDQYSLLSKKGAARDGCRPR